MILRRLFYLLLILGCATPCFAQQKTSETDKLFTADTLKKNLHAKTDDEKKFCDYIIQKRNDGSLPTLLIYGIYQKAMTKEPTKRFTYFKNGLEILCKQNGILLYPPPSKTSPNIPEPTPFSLKNLFRRG